MYIYSWSVGQQWESGSPFFFPCCFMCVLKCWLQKMCSHYCVPQNKDPFKMRANMFLSIELFPWRLGSSIIVFGTQTETDQTHRQPTDQNGSCGSGTLHALIRFGLGWFWCVHTKTSTPVCLWPCQVVCQKRPNISNRKLGSKSRGLLQSSPPWCNRSQSTVTQLLWV